MTTLLSCMHHVGMSHDIHTQLLKLVYLIKYKYIYQWIGSAADMHTTGINVLAYISRNIPGISTYLPSLLSVVHQLCQLFVLSIKTTNKVLHSYF